VIVDAKYFPLKDSGKTHPHLKTLYTVKGRIPRPSQFTDTQGTSSTDPTNSDDDQHVPMKDAESGQTGKVSDELVSDEPVSHIPLDYESSDDDLVQDVLDEMKETISHLPAFNPLEDQQTLRPPLPTELTVDPPSNEPQTNSHAEDALQNAVDSWTHQEPEFVVGGDFIGRQSEFLISGDSEKRQLFHVVTGGKKEKEEKKGRKRREKGRKRREKGRKGEKKGRKRKGKKERENMQIV
jgi:hypothetical protein